MTGARTFMDETRPPELTGRRGTVRLDGRRVGVIEESDDGFDALSPAVLAAIVRNPDGP